MKSKFYKKALLVGFLFLTFFLTNKSIHAVINPYGTVTINTVTNASSGTQNRWDNMDIEVSVGYSYSGPGSIIGREVYIDNAYNGTATTDNGNSTISENPGRLHAGFPYGAHNIFVKLLIQWGPTSDWIDSNTVTYYTYDPATRNPPPAPDPVYGCTDPSAANYNSSATADDGSCTYICTTGPSGYTKCADENGTCSFSGTANVAYGCSGSYNVHNDVVSSTACNNATFGDPAPGVVKACFYQALSPATIRIHTRNYSQSLISTATYSISPGGSTSGGYTEVSVSPSSGGTSYNIHLNSSPSGYTYTHSASSDGVTTYNGSMDITMWPGQGKDVTFYFNTTPVYGCTDPSANNYNPNANTNQGCTYTITGCTDPSANNYNSNANTNDGSCTYTVAGCTDPSANNYNPNANVNQGCTYTAPTVSISASPATINQGSSSTLSWSSTNASSCSASGGWSGAKATSGSESVSPASTATYSITCTGSGGSASASASVSVTPNRTLTISIASGSGVVSGTGISCPGDCSDSYTDGTWVTLIATPSSGYNFSSWSGACAGQGSTCSTQMTSDKSTSVNFVVAFNYSLSNDGNKSVQKGGIDQYGLVTITKTLTAGSTQGVTLSASGMPTGVSVRSSGQGIAPTSNSTATITVSPDAPAGTYPITITGSPLSKTTSFNLTVVDSPALVVSCSVSPNSVQLGESVTFSATAEGGSGTGYVYTWSGPGIPTNPAPTANPYTLSYSTIGQKTGNVTVRDSLYNQGTCNPVPTVNVQFDPEFEEF